MAGTAESTRPELNTQRLATFLAGPVTLLCFEEADAKAADAIRGELEASGKPIGAYDLLIASQASARKWTLVTANLSESYA